VQHLRGRKKFKVRIRHKLILAFLAVGLIPMILSTFIVAHTLAKKIENDMEHLLQAASSQTLTLIDNYKKECAHELEDFLTNFSPQDLQNPEQALLLRVASAEEPFILWIPGKMENMNYTSDAAKPIPTLLELELNDLRTLAAGAIMPVKLPDGGWGNILVGYALGKSFAQDMENRTGVEVRIFMRIGEEGKTIFVKDLEMSQLLKDTVLHEGRALFLKHIKYRKQPYMGLFVPLKGVGGRILGFLFFGLPWRYTFGEAISKSWFFPFLIVISAIVAAGMGYTIAQGISKPIRLLSRAVRRVADGDYDQRIEIRTRDEVGELSEAFNLMTERLKKMREMEEEMRRKDKLAALGELSAGVAHEIRNPLGVIKNAAQLLHQHFAKRGEAQELAQLIAEEVDRLNDVVTNFLDFARPAHPTIVPCDIKGVLEKVLQIAEDKIKEQGIKVEKSWDENLPPVLCDPDQCIQAFLNIVLNAVEAMEQGGKLHLYTRLWAEERKWAEIIIEDTGCGIPEEDLPRIFDPFFSKKEGGTGLGLAIVHKIIVDNLGGRIKVERKDIGTRFRIFLPVAEDKDEGKDSDS